MCLHLEKVLWQFCSLKVLPVEQRPWRTGRRCRKGCRCTGRPLWRGGSGCRPSSARCWSRSGSRARPPPAPAAAAWCAARTTRTCPGTRAWGRRWFCPSWARGWWRASWTGGRSPPLARTSGSGRLFHRPGFLGKIHLDIKWWRCFT